MEESVFVPQEQWASLPVQPTAGSWRRRRRWAVIGVAGSALWAAIVGAEVLAGTARAGEHLWDPMGPFVLLCGMGIVMAVRQARTEREEQRHGYTTVRGRRRSLRP